MTTIHRIVLVALTLGGARKAWGQDTTRSPHGPLRLPCAECHSPDSWRPAHIASDFDHARLGFALAGAHVQATCVSCHRQLSFQGTPTQCASCHTDPHRGELSQSCEHCHTSRSFVDRSLLVSNHQLTAFPLTGAHLAADCESCHQPGAQGKMTFLGQPTDCYACHQQTFAATNNPDHQAGGLPTRCIECHNTSTWLASTFNHQATRFPLTGAHLAVACNVCHADKVYAGKSTACVSCHQTDYSATNDPGHQGAGFSTDCASCHTTASWNGATFNHDAPYFPIYSGTHAGRWTSCTDCHTDPANYAVFDCLSCHGKTETDSHHTQVTNYQYTSTACYACHKNGRGG